MHGVSPSYYIFIASAQQIQFHRVIVGDSGAIVTPFMQDGTYPPRNFATLGPSGIRPPFTEYYHFTFMKRFIIAALGRSQGLYVVLTLQAPVFLVNSRHPFFTVTLRHPFFRSYRANLPSSFNNVCSLPSHILRVYLCWL